MTKQVTRLQLDIKQKFNLTALINAEYTSSGHNDTDFATYASKKLGFTIPPGTISHYRKGLDIKVNDGVDKVSLKSQLDLALRENATLKRAFLEEGRELPEGITPLVEDDTSETTASADSEIPQP